MRIRYVCKKKVTLRDAEEDVHKIYIEVKNF